MTDKKSDDVHHPKHYTCGQFEVIDILADKLTEEQFEGFLIGNTLKYILRHRHKGNPLQDIEKSLWYLERYRQRLESKAKV